MNREEERLKISIPFGMWDVPSGRWYHNPNLTMTADEQYAHNVKHGYLPGKREHMGIFSGREDDMKVTATARKKVEIFVEDVFAKRAYIQIRVTDTDTGEVLDRRDEAVFKDSTIVLEVDTSVEADS
jgi:hypothetical protein